MNAYFAAQGLQGLRLAAHGLHGFLAAQGLHGFFAAHGLHGFFAAQGLHARLLAAQGLHGLHAATCTTSDAACDCAAGNAVMPATAATAPSAATDCFRFGIEVFFMVVSMFRRAATGLCRDR